MLQLIRQGTLFKLFTLLVFFLVSLSSKAVFLEYEHYSQAEQSEINGPRLIDSEYQSDKLTYLLPIDYLYSWLADDNSFQYSAGSLGPTRFLTRGRFKFKKKLAERTYLKLLYVDRGDLEMTRKSLIFELSYQLNSFFELSLYGEPSTLKKEDNAGLALTLSPSENDQIRLFYTAVHFSHNKRNESTDFYSKKPSSLGVLWRSLDSSSKSFIELGLRLDQPLQQIFPDSGRVYNYGYSVFNFTTKQSLWQDWDFLLIDISSSSGFESDSQNTDQGVQRWETQKFEALFQYQNPIWFIDWFGVKIAHQNWQSSAGHVIHNDILPHLWIPIQTSQRQSWANSWRAGYEMTWHRGRGLDSLRSINDSNDKAEHRLNIRYELQFSKTARLFTLLTFDLDEFGSGQTWEGGSMQFSAQF